MNVRHGGSGLRLIAALFAACACNIAAAADLYDTVNGLRSGQGACTVTPAPAPLTRQPALERAAQALSRGAGLPESLRDADYRARTSVFISLSGDGVGDKAEALLGARYCAQLLRSEITEIGIFQDARHLWIVLAAPFAPQVSMSAEAAAERVLELVNEARAETRSCGRKSFKAARPLRWNDVLAAVAQRHAEDMAQFNYFSHTGRDISTPAARVTRGGYKFRATGENIAAGQTTPEDAVAAWLKSPQHCENLMNPAYTEMGVAYAVARESDAGIYWTQVFGTPR